MKFATFTIGNPPRAVAINLDRVNAVFPNALAPEGVVSTCIDTGDAEATYQVNESFDEVMDRIRMAEAVTQ